ncbi:MAG TPA: hypothetical protein VF310_14725 [Vicinamibacteria bacterium]
MKATCSDLEPALRGDDGERAAAWREHAQGCPRCAEELAFWEDLAAAAPALRQEWPSPALRERIRADLAAEQQRPRRLTAGDWLPLAAAAGLLLALLGRSLTPSPSPASSPSAATEAAEAATAVRDAAGQRLLTERTLAEVEEAEAAYVRSIEALSRVAEPHLQEAHSAVLDGYREKLLLLDSAIAACRAAAERNRFNAHLRLELLYIYQEKQRTLESLLKEDPHAL